MWGAKVIKGIREKAKSDSDSRLQEESQWVSEVL
jgi:hypothetical protein